MSSKNDTDCTSRAPYPQSSIISGMAWDEQVLKSRQRSGDNWPIAWIDEDLQITSYGDGGGFSGKDPELTLGFARVNGDPPNHRTEDFASDADIVAGYGRKGIKSSDMLYVNSVLYMFVRNYIPDGRESNYTNARLAWSTDLGISWSWADWYFSSTFGCPAFVQFGQNYKGARDEYVYIVSQANNDAYLYSPDIVMARVPADQVSERSSFQFYTGQDVTGAPQWSNDIEKEKIHIHRSQPHSTGRCYL